MMCYLLTLHFVHHELLYIYRSKWMNKNPKLKHTHCSCDVIDHCLMVFGYRTLNYLVVLHRFVHASVPDETVLHLRLFPFAFLTFDRILQLWKEMEEKNRNKKHMNLLANLKFDVFLSLKSNVIRNNVLNIMPEEDWKPFYTQIWTECDGW